MDILLSPFQQLPNEILGLIFESACTDNLLQQYPWPTVRKWCGEPPTKLSLPVIAYLPALAISAVCTRWRFLALASPRIWSQIRVEIAPRGEVMSTTQSGFRSTLQLYLDRSADSPLLIGLQTPGALDADKSDLSALPLLLDHTSRWQTFSYTGDFDLGSCEGFCHHPSFPILEALNLRGCEALIQRADFDCFEHAPKLCAFSTDYLKSHSPWTQLTTLDVRALDMDVLQQCRSLTVLKIQRIWPTSELSNMTLVNLETFTLFGFGDECDLEDMFSRITLPSLGELIIYPEDSPYTNDLIWPLNAFIAFILRSSCTLTTLSLSGVRILDLDFIATLHLLPSLTKLSFDDDFGRVTNPITSLFLSSLTLHDTAFERGSIVPNLCSLSIQVEGTSFDDTAFIEMVLSRWLPDPSYAATIGVASMMSMVLRFRKREVDEDVYRPLYELDKVGMRWGREVHEEAKLRPLCNLERMGMRVVITGQEYHGH
ncbi:hypothetical protein BT96DRAFT_913629 [Gymnopus androsaceus JB14]|uniref:Uncharacterized protein n=1 Tax=Gymnopus androsaceus JB14 TaxID=1447944 RepID=A0A6A4II66_9AGAR|nr:hypothetical protein BT96DRAFT_913629 [Gymnopus androsaceus JB14]